ncbi:MAG: FKBP-type peptidyl-prolyl cis-trans isomerase, partial [Bacteroidaceae bacterium]|nr:FKBP-type peptidyl-prolyl cis-trans isomerase [Bacteroidaceae bacterium]
MEPNKYIRVSYELTAIEGGERESIETATRENPYMFVSGLGISLDAFEAQVIPLNAGDTFDFTLTVEQGYGEYHADFVQEVPRSIFEIDGKIDSKYIYEGAVVPLQNAEGQRFNGLIQRIGEKNVIVDLNHPLAGKELNFKGEVIESREATNDEIQGILKMITGEGCGGGCGNCGGGCGGCGEGGCEGGCGGC